MQQRLAQTSGSHGSNHHCLIGIPIIVAAVSNLQTLPPYWISTRFYLGAVRSGAKEVWSVEDSGRHPEALRCAKRLADKHTTFAVSHNLVCVLHR